MRLREIKKYAGTWIVKLDPSDARDFNLREGDQINVEQALEEKRSEDANKTNSNN